MNKKILFASAFSLLFIFGSLFFTEKKADAQTGLITPFGGKITNVKYCCNGIVLTIQNNAYPQFGGDFFMSWADVANPTVNYMYYQVFYGGSQNTVGISMPFGFCSEIEEECEGGSYVRGGTVTKIGTGVPGGTSN